MLHTIESIFEIIVEYGILILEIIGAALILIAGVKALLALLGGKGDCRLIMGEGIATALSFLLGGEALKTIIAPDWKDIGMTCAILLMRAAMSLLIHWETHGTLGKGNEEGHSTGGAEIGK